MQAVILAAGMGKRLKDLTRDNTKCMVKVNGVPLIDRMIAQLAKFDLSRIVIVTGYEGNKLRQHIDSLNCDIPIVYINNPIYDKTNNIYSLSLSKDYLVSEDTLLFESDIIFEDEVLNSLVNDERDTLALVDKYQPWMDGTCLKLDSNDNIISFISGRKFDFNNTDGCYKTVNIYKFSKHFSETHYVPFLMAYQEALGQNEYYEQVLKVISALDDAEIKAKRLNGQKWYEIDDVQDLDIAEALFCDDDFGRVCMMEERYGGYWRFPDLQDFCYLVNPYYPPQKMKDEIKASFDRLIINYPSGMKINSLLASKNFGVGIDNIVVGNGAAELIKSLLDNSDGIFGFIRPTFEEYPNRYKPEKSVFYTPKNKDFSYSCDDLTEYFSDKNITWLVLINPDNPSGNYISKKDLFKLIEWTKDNKINFIVDESFADFADEPNNTLFDQSILADNPHLYVIKSISKSYGVPGVRLGVLASGNGETINMIKKDVSIWNINSFAEFFLQIMEKYKADYSNALYSFREERKRMYEKLTEIHEIRVTPSQANYFMIELLNNHKVVDLTRYLLTEHNILIKDLYNKLGNKEYIRVAIKDSDSNDLFLDAVESYFRKKGKKL